MTYSPVVAFSPVVRYSFSPVVAYSPVVAPGYAPVVVTPIIGRRALLRTPVVLPAPMYYAP